MLVAVMLLNPNHHVCLRVCMCEGKGIVGKIAVTEQYFCSFFNTFVNHFFNSYKLWPIFKLTKLKNFNLKVH